MSGSKHPYLDGIEFKLCDVFQSPRRAESSISSSTLSSGVQNVRIKDVNEVLAHCHYDFSLEHKVMADYSQRKRMEKDVFLRKENDRINNNRRQDNSPSPSSSSSSRSNNTTPAPNHLLKELCEDSILTPLPVARADNLSISKIDSKDQIDFNDFDTDNNQDPFSNAELNTIDDMKVLTDVLRNVATSNQSTVTSPEVRPPSDQPVNNSSKKEALLDMLGDMLTEEVESKLQSRNNSNSEYLSQPPRPQSESPSFEKCSPSTSSTSLPSRLDVDTNQHNTTVIRPTAKPRSKHHSPQPPPPKSKPLKVELGGSSVADRVLADKSKEEKQRFEETIKKALTSLPQLPKPSARSNPVNKTTAFNNGKIHGHVRMSSHDNLVNGLNESEREFVKSICSMGFQTRHVMRTMQKYGKDHKEVVERLCMFQRLNDDGYSFDEVDDALEVFNGEEEQAVRYLKIQRQLVDMGFPSDKVKQALLLHNSNQSKALEALMAGS